MSAKHKMLIQETLNFSGFSVRISMRWSFILYIK